MANKRKYLTEPIDCYLTPKARKLVEEYVALGIDRDLAITMIEAVLEDTEMYSLEDEEAGNEQ